MPKPVSKSVSRSSVVRRLWLLGVLALVVGAISYPPAANVVIDGFNKVTGSHVGHMEKGFVLGLDLQGGTHLEYEADVSKVVDSERANALSGVRDVIERRVNSIGVSEPLITTARAGNAWRVSVELAGIRDVNQAIKLIGETPILEFKIANTDKPRDLTADEKKQMDAKNADAYKQAQGVLDAAKKDPASFDATSSDIGWIKDKAEYGQIYNASVGVATGTIIGHVIETDTGYAVARIDDRKDAGMEIEARHILIQYAGATSAPSSTTATKDEAKKQIDDILTQATPKNFADLAKKYSQEPGADQSGGDLGWFGKGMMVSQFEDPAFALKVGEISKVVETPFGFHIIYKYGERPTTDVRVRAFVVQKTTAADILPPPGDWKATELTGKQLKHAQLDFDQRTGNAQVAIQFDDEGTKLFAQLTKDNVGKQIAIFLDGQVISAPVVQTEITNGNAVINGSFTIDDAKVLAQRLQAGALPVPIHLIAQQTVGPTLGQDSVNKSIVAGLWGFLFIMAFMLFWYRLPGLFAIVSLTLYVGISFAIFKIVPITLSLSGIAGFILSLGIAVDANVLIFERLKEELRAGKTYGVALEEAFRRAWPSIRDGNMTTLISCAVLYWFSSSIIKGFAMTLAVGVVISLFTAIVVTRTILRFVTGTRIVPLLPWFFLNSPKKD